MNAPVREQRAVGWTSAILAGLVCAVPIVHAQDGGVRSPFAAGTGLRGLAMGGAQAAIVADGEALDWNPAGLGLAPRAELLLGRTSYFGAEVVESQVVAVVPSWRWGGLALGLRHLGVSGVEGRDARNQVTDPDLEASALQVSLGYGRNLGGWSLGGALDLAREQVAGNGATGLGLDLGVQVRPLDAFAFAPAWTEGISAGVAWTNVIEPSFRLDEDTVTDPAGVRIGLGYTRPALSGGGLTAAFDLETSARTEPRAFTGLEFRLHPTLALRSGLGRHGVTAGVGFDWKEFEVDYALEDTDLGSVHRIGLAYSFGRSTEERRSVYAARQEEALQVRLAEASARREAERIDQLLTETETLRAAGRIDEALATVDVARTLAPDRPETAVLEARCWQDRGRALETEGALTDAALAYGRVLALVPEDPVALEAQTRVQAESDRLAQREAHLREQFTQALDAFGRGDLLAAREGFAELAREKSDREAQEMLRRTEDAIARRAGDHLEQARRLLARHLVPEAGEEAKAARRLAPGLAGLEVFEAELGRKREALASRDGAGHGDRGDLADGTLGTGQRASGEGAPGDRARPRGADAEGAGGADSGGARGKKASATGRTGASGSSASTPRMDAAELTDLYRRGLEASQASRSEDAIRYFELVFSAAPDHALVRENLVREYLTLGMERFAAGDLDEAIGIWQRALEADPSDEKARGYLERALRHKDRSAEILGSAQ